MGHSQDDLDIFSFLAGSRPRASADQPDEAEGHQGLEGSGPTDPVGTSLSAQGRGVASAMASIHEPLGIVDTGPQPHQGVVMQPVATAAPTPTELKHDIEVPAVSGARVPEDRSRRARYPSTQVAPVDLEHHPGV